MSKRILSFDQYKKIHESYSIEEKTDKAESVLDSSTEDELTEGEPEDGVDLGDLSDENDSTIEGDDEISLDETETEEELDENKELKEKITAIIDENYKESLKDIFDGIINELEDDIDIETALDAISDVLSKKMEELANSEDEETEEGEAEKTETEEGNAEAEQVEGEEAPVEGSEEAAPVEGEEAPEEEQTIEL
jgi:hypothetical protein